MYESLGAGRRIRMNRRRCCHRRLSLNMKPTLINLNTSWTRIGRFVNHTLAQLALDIGMQLWCRDHRYKGTTWNPKRGPWAYSGTDYWCHRKRPSKNSPEWYRCAAACHWLRGFGCALAELAYPNHKWHIIEGKNHSTVIGRSRRAVRVFDLLLWDYYPRNAAEQILKFAGYPNKCEYLTLESELVNGICGLRKGAM
jgi:hypothetical protein